ncbi:Putative lipoprotein [hydrothermal vent metagenome]|uniref:Putative lipoprotein n=1 Tax=hydrothermal vent metagenome TaxID=652676 RepID=A0A1W1CTC6_9ZZZZ
MKKIQTFLTLFSLFFLLGGCVNKTYSQQERIFLVFKTSSIKYADLGFMYEGEEDLKIEMYSNGQALKALKISQTSICLSLFECLDKKTFNQKVLSEYYPHDILSHILRGDKIFSSQNLLNEKNGFSQKISNIGKYEIDYRVLDNKIIFRDTLNAITIKVKRLK